MSDEPVRSDQVGSQIWWILVGTGQHFESFLFSTFCAFEWVGSRPIFCKYLQIRSDPANQLQLSMS